MADIGGNIICLLKSNYWDRDTRFGRSSMVVAPHAFVVQLGGKIWAKCSPNQIFFNEQARAKAGARARVKTH